MSEILTNNKYYSDIADTIRQMKGVATTYKPREMAGALRDMYSTEVEGVPPLTFPSNGNNLLNYKIDGASGGIGDLVTDTSDENYGKYKIPAVISGNNLAKWDTHLQPQPNGIVFNDINSISSIINVSNINNIYIFGDRTKLNSNVYRIGKSNEPISLNSQTTRITFTGGILDTSDCNYVIVSCSIYNTETTFDDIKNSFMIVEGTTSPENFEPYIEPTTTNIYLDEPIEANESKKLSDTNVNIPTINGTNILSIDTTIQPSNVYVQAPKNNSYNI